MSKMRLFLACCLASVVSTVAVGPPAAAEEASCQNTFVLDYVSGLVPAPDAGSYLTIEDGTITIRGDLVLTDAAGLVEQYARSTADFVACLEQTLVGVASPYIDCVMERSEAIRTSPDPVARYVEVGTDLVVKIHYELAINEAIQIGNCNGIVTYGG